MHELRGTRTNCVNMTDAIARLRREFYCTAKRCRFRTKAGSWPFKLATRDFSEPIRLRLTGTRLGVAPAISTNSLSPERR